MTIPDLRTLALTRPLVVLDCETTGLDPARDRLVELAAVKFTPNSAPAARLDLIDPGVPIPEAATAVHGITDAAVAGHPDFAAVAPRWLRLLADADLAGFNLAFDLAFLAAEFARCGREFPLAGRALIDPMRVFHAREPRDLAAAVRFYCGRDHGGAHSALADAAAAAEVLDAQLARYADLPRTPALLHALFAPPGAAGKLRVEGGAAVFAFGKYSGFSLDGVAAADPGYLDWLLGKDFAPDTKAAVRAALRRSGRGGRARGEFELPDGR